MATVVVFIEIRKSSALIQSRMSDAKFARSLCTDPPGGPDEVGHPEGPRDQEMLYEGRRRTHVPYVSG